LQAFYKQQKFPIAFAVPFAATVFLRGSLSTPNDCVNLLVLKNACKADILLDCDLESFG
jgi:hypothetical protein